MTNKDNLRIIVENENIYSSVPEYLLLDKVGAKARFIKRDLIKKFLLAHQGRENAVPLNKIAKELKLSARGNSVEFRLLAAKILEEEKFPIVTCVNGYFYAKDSEEIFDNIEDINAKINGLYRRRKALLKIATERLDNDPQTKLLLF